MPAPTRLVALAVAVVIVGFSCSRSGTSNSSAITAPAVPPTPSTVTEPGPDISAVYDPVAAGEELPTGFRQLLRRDDIAPVYTPSFVTSDLANWADDSLVIGVFLEDEARAYPVGFLNRREMVIDNHRGIPTLVTW